MPCEKQKEIHFFLFSQYQTYWTIMNSHGWAVAVAAVCHIIPYTWEAGRGECRLLCHLVLMQAPFQTPQVQLPNRKRAVGWCPHQASGRFSINSMLWCLWPSLWPQFWCSLADFSFRHMQCWYDYCPSLYLPASWKPPSSVSLASHLSRLSEMDSCVLSLSLPMQCQHVHFRWDGHNLSSGLLSVLPVCLWFYHESVSQLVHLYEP